MTKNKTMMLVALAAIPVVIAAAYFIAQPSGSTELAKPEVRDTDPKVAGTAAKPASTQFSSQTAVSHTPSKSHARDSSASQKFIASRQCAFHDVEISNLRSVTAACERFASTPNLLYYKECHAQALINRDLISALQADSQGCPAGKEATNAYFQDTIQAAKAGDPDAQLCYIESKFWVNGRAMDFSDDDRAEYQRDAPIYIQQALERGDWRVATLLSSKRASGMRNTVGSDDAYVQYKMNRLLRLGADGQYAETLDRDAQIDYLSAGISQAPRLSQEQIAQANAEAKDYYDRSFKNQPPLSEAPKVCTPASPSDTK